MAKKIEFNSELSKLPNSGHQARAFGKVYYFTGKRCKRGHLSARYASSGNCVDCIEEKRGITFNRFRGSSAKRSKENQALAEIAMESGFTTYKSLSPCPKGHVERFIGANNCCECSNIQNKKRGESARWKRIMKEYGLSKNEFHEMLKSQNSECKICKKDISKKQHVDHCHKTGRVRSLLCSKCNQAIGLLGEDLDVIKSAINYIRRFSDEIERLPAKIN